MLFFNAFASYGRVGIALLILTALSVGVILYFWVDNYLRVYKLKRQRLGVPVINLKGDDYDAAAKEYVTDAESLLRRGHKEYKHDVYQVWGSFGFTTIVSPDFLEELSSLPPGTIDFYKGAMKRMVGDYEWVKLGDPLGNHTVLKDLTQKFWGLLPELEEEISYALRTELPQCKDWTPVTIQPRILRIVALLTGRVFVGPELNRNEEWIATSCGFMKDIYVAGGAIFQYSHIMRPFAARFLVPAVKRVWAHEATARRLLVPIMEQRRRNEESDPNYQKPNDWMQWLMDNNEKEEKPHTFAELAHVHLLLCFAALHTSTMAVTHLLFDLAARQEYIEPLREEQYAVARESGCTHSKSSYLKMVKMDSFVKESQRLNPPSMLTYARLVMKDFTLSNGLKLPRGTYMVIPAGPVSLDDDNWESADEFRGFRFSDMRSRSKEEAHKYQYATITPSALHFGHGRLGCPGRFFAGYEFKAIIARFIDNFDIKLVDEKSGRPANKTVGAAILLDPSLQLMFRKRKAVVAGI
ncbi:cytochrome P450 monooxygenase [Xylaria sp. FL0933]|nr:cytochrome P450 monooxygenase [Xylaria sp. FL0933]